MPDKQRSLKYYTLFGFFVIGIITLLLGQVLPILSTRLHLNDAEAGTFFIAFYGGSLLGTLFVTRIARRFGFVTTTVIGIVMMIVGLPGLNCETFFACWIAIFVYGIGLGFTIPAVNLLTIEITPVERQAAAINLINFAWGIGAICSYPFVAAFSQNNSLVSVTASLVVGLVLLAVCFVSARGSVHVVAMSSPVDESADRIWSRPAAWLFVLFGFFVIGIESSMGGWLTTYSDTFDKASNVINLTTVYFAFLVFGRGLASLISRRLRESTLISICAVTLLIGISLLVFFADSLSVVGAAISGLGSSAIFPTNMVRFTKVFGAGATRNATPVFIAGTCGSAFVSWLIGQISTSYGGLRFGIAVLLFAALLVLVIQIAIVLVFDLRERPR
ncbi:MAG: hypothetical protein DMF63_18715 [Acidobacteria bacterium]|nr:MAG: hypothetical protein DMF63_18715 [Acidobacteriota bacterium]